MRLRKMFPKLCRIYGPLPPLGILMTVIHGEIHNCEMNHGNIMSRVEFRAEQIHHTLSLNDIRSSGTKTHGRFKYRALFFSAWLMRSFVVIVSRDNNLMTSYHTWEARRNNETRPLPSRVITHNGLTRLLINVSIFIDNILFFMYFCWGKNSANERKNELDGCKFDILRCIVK